MATGTAPKGVYSADIIIQDIPAAVKPHSLKFQAVGLPLSSLGYGIVLLRKDPLVNVLLGVHIGPS